MLIKLVKTSSTKLSEQINKNSFIFFCLVNCFKIKINAWFTTFTIKINYNIHKK